MRILATAASFFLSRTNPSPFSADRAPSGRTVCPDRLLNVAAYPSGQSYAWGGPCSVSHGFAPAIGYDAFYGGNGY